MTATDPYGTSWYASTMVPTPERRTLASDIDVDVCIVGGGLAGLTVARELARRRWSVAVLEANRIGWSASGTNAGVVAPGFSERIDRLIERLGGDHARALWDLSAAGVEYVRAAAADLAGVAPVPGQLVIRPDDRAQTLRGHADLLREQCGAEVAFWPSEQVETVLSTATRLQALYVPSAFHLHPLNYALGLAAAAEQAGARIFENTPAVEIDYAGVRKPVRTPAARVRAAHVVLAGGAHLGSLLPLVSETVLPLVSHVATTAPLGDRLREAIRFAGVVSHADRAGAHYRVVDGDTLLWSGGLTTASGAAQRLARQMRWAIGRAYPQLREAEVAHARSAAMAYAVHKMPQIGEVAPGLWIANGFGVHGLATTAMAGDLIARAIAEGDDRWRLFSPYGLVWAGGSFGRVAVEATLRFAHLRASVQDALARRRKRAAAAKDTLPIVAAEALAPAAEAPAAEVPTPPVTEAADPVEPTPDAAENGRKKAKPRGKRKAAAAAVSDDLTTVVVVAAPKPGTAKSRRGKTRNGTPAPG